MKRSAFWKIGAAALLFGVLLFAIRKASAPIRIEQQFEAQVAAQLRGTKTSDGTFRAVRVGHLKYNPNRGVYDVRYEISRYSSKHGRKARIFVDRLSRRGQSWEHDGLGCTQEPPHHCAKISIRE